MLPNSHRVIMSVIVLVLVILTPGANDTLLADDFGALPDRRQRVDGGYVIEVRHIQANGQMKAGDYGPSVSPGPLRQFTVIQSKSEGDKNAIASI